MEGSFVRLNYHIIHTHTASVVIGVVGASIFIVIQAILLVDFAHTWAKRWSVPASLSPSILYLSLLPVCFCPPHPLSLSPPPLVCTHLSTYSCVASSTSKCQMLLSLSLFLSLSLADQLSFLPIGLQRQRRQTISCGT